MSLRLAPLALIAYAFLAGFAGTLGVELALFAVSHL